MPTIEIEGRIFTVDGDGFLSTPEQWNEDVAKLFAKYDGIEEMNEKHWSIVKIIRNNWEEKGNAPMIRTICQETGVKLREIYELFPLGPARGACRVAGLPKPDGCVLANFSWMFWYHWIAISSLGICLTSSSIHFIRLVLLGKPVDYSTPAGTIASSVKYSFAGAMNPLKKESAYLHLPTYIAGIFYHLGSFLSIVLFFLILADITVPVILTFLIALFLLFSVTCGTSILIKRIVKRGLRDLSAPDDYLSNLLVTIFQLMTAYILVRNQLYPVYFLLASVLLLYFPLGKLKHAIYFFAARYHLGFFYGWRGTWPPKKT